MAYQKKTWLARLGQGLNKFIFNGGSKVTLDSSPDVVTQEGTALSADNMNDLEQRIDDEFTNVNSAITSLSTEVATLIHTVDTGVVTLGSQHGYINLTSDFGVPYAARVVGVDKLGYNSGGDLDLSLNCIKTSAEWLLAYDNNGTIASSNFRVWWIM